MNKKQWKEDQEKVDFNYVKTVLNSNAVNWMEFAQNLLEELAEAEGYPDVMIMLEDFMADANTSSNAVCVSCGAYDRMEPDQDAGYCSKCGRNTVKHAFILAGII